MEASIADTSGTKELTLTAEQNKLEMLPVGKLGIVCDEFRCQWVMLKVCFTLIGTAWLALHDWHCMMHDVSVGALTAEWDELINILHPSRYKSALCRIFNMHVICAGQPTDTLLKSIRRSAWNSLICAAHSSDHVIGAAHSHIFAAQSLIGAAKSTDASLDDWFYATVAYNMLTNKNEIISAAKSTDASLLLQNHSSTKSCSSVAGSTTLRLYNPRCHFVCSFPLPFITARWRLFKYRKNPNEPGLAD